MMAGHPSAFVGLPSDQQSSFSSVNGFIHDSFPPAHTSSQCRSLSRTGRRHQFVHRKVVPDDSFIVTGSRLSVDNQKLTEQRVNVLFPCLVSDQSVNNYMKGQRCAFTENQKSFLRMKGIKISDMYSLNRNDRTRKQSRVYEYDKRSYSDLDLPSLMNNSKTGQREKISNKETQKMWSPHNSRKVLTGNPMYSRLIKGLENESRIPGHVRASDVRDKRLGKVLTQEHLYDLLNEDKTNTSFLY